MELGEKLKELRKEHNLSQQQFADLLHVSRQAVSRWETKKAEPDIETLKKISQIFKVTVDHLIGNDEEEADLTPHDMETIQKHYPEYAEYLEALNLSILMLAAVITIVIPVAGVLIDIGIIAHLIRIRNKKYVKLLIGVTVFILLMSGYHTYSVIF